MGSCRSRKRPQTVHPQFGSANRRDLQTLEFYRSAAPAIRWLRPFGGSQDSTLGVRRSIHVGFSHFGKLFWDFSSVPDHGGVDRPFVLGPTSTEGPWPVRDPRWDTLNDKGEATGGWLDWTPEPPRVDMRWISRFERCLLCQIANTWSDLAEYQVAFGRANSV